MNRIIIIFVLLLLVFLMPHNAFAEKTEVLDFEESIDLSEKNSHNCGLLDCTTISLDFIDIKDLELILDISLRRMATMFYEANKWNDLIIQEINISNDLKNSIVGVVIKSKGAISDRENHILKKDMEAILDKIYEFTGKLDRLILRSHPLLEGTKYLFGFKNIKIERNKIRFEVILIIKDKEKEEENKDKDIEI